MSDRIIDCPAKVIVILEFAVWAAAGMDPIANRVVSHATAAQHLPVFHIISICFPFLRTWGGAGASACQIQSVLLNNVISAASFFDGT
jgi:hypothetical protein